MPSNWQQSLYNLQRPRSDLAEDVDVDADEENTFEIEIDCDTFFVGDRIGDVVFIFLYKFEKCPFSLSAIFLWETQKWNGQVTKTDHLATIDGDK